MNTLLRRSPLALFVFALALAPACEDYEPPPDVRVEGLASGQLSDSRAPIVIDFGTRIVPETLRLKIALAETDVEGNLFDEDKSEETELRMLVRRDVDEGDRGAKFELDPSGTTMHIVLDAALPVGPKLVLVVEPGLESTSGRALTYRKKVVFVYTVHCATGARAVNFKSGSYFALLDVEQPIGTQIQLFANIVVDPESGTFISQFTNGDRITDPNRCPTPCDRASVCRLLPAPECVPPSTRAGTLDEYPDFYPNVTPPIGYSFTVRGCAVDDGSAVGVVTAPANMVVLSPPVTVQGLVMTAQFTTDPSGLFRATGSLTADGVLLGGNLAGPGKGTMSAILIPDGNVPPGIPPAPPPEP